MEKNKIITPEEDFSIIKECDYKGEHYLVRDNGAVLRKSNGKRNSAIDEVWTFGTKNKKNGYMYISSHRVHIIVATAFHGIKDSNIYVVDHIDTNRCNNRPENLRWLTRLENALLNPDTVRKITYLCGGDITKFLKDPSCLREFEGNPNIAWMRTVSSKEAKAAYLRVQSINSKNFGHRENKVLKEKERTEAKEWFGGDVIVDNWRFTEPEKPVYEIPEPVFTKAKYPSSALQKDWKTPTEFLCCPENAQSAPLLTYCNNLIKGKLFSRNYFSDFFVIDYALIEDNKTLLVASGVDIDGTIEFQMSYGLVKIYYSGEQFIHEGLGTFWTKNGVMKQFTLLQGKEWDGPDSIDDYM